MPQHSETGDVQGVDTRPMHVRAHEKRALGFRNTQIGPLLGGIGAEGVKFDLNYGRGKANLVGAPEMCVIASLVKSGQIPLATLEEKYGDETKLKDQYLGLTDASREFVDYFRDPEHWGNTYDVMASNFGITLNGIKKRKELIFADLGFRDRIQIEVFAYLLTLKGIPMIGHTGLRRRFASPDGYSEEVLRLAQALLEWGIVAPPPQDSDE